MTEPNIRSTLRWGCDSRIHSAAIGGSGFNRSYDRFREAPDGQRLLDERPDIAAVLTDSDQLGWDDDFHYVVHRGIALHDLLHVLGGYGPDVGGEFGVLGFTHGQVGARMTGGSVAMLMVAPLGVRRADRLRWW